MSPCALSCPPAPPGPPAPVRVRVAQRRVAVEVGASVAGDPEEVDPGEGRGDDGGAQEDDRRAACRRLELEGACRDPVLGERVDGALEDGAVARADDHLAGLVDDLDADLLRGARARGADAVEDAQDRLFVAVRKRAPPRRHHTRGHPGQAERERERERERVL